MLLRGSSTATAVALTAAYPHKVTLAEFSTAAASTASVTDAPEVTASVPRQVVTNRGIGDTAPEIVLYQYEVCPFCNKVRAFLDYHDIAYQVVEVDPLRKTELASFDKSYRKVPIAVVNGQQINGSGAVIDHVRDLVHGNKSEPSELDRHWIAWLDDTFIHLVAPNIYRSPAESLQTFEYIADNAKFSAWQRGTIRYMGATAMYFVGRRLKKKYEIEDERKAMHDALKEWTDAIREGGGKFLGGRDSPGVADLSIYGVLKAIQTFDTFQDVRDNNVELGEWFDRTKAAVGEEAVLRRD